MSDRSSPPSKQARSVALTILKIVFWGRPVAARALLGIDLVHAADRARAGVVSLAVSRDVPRLFAGSGCRRHAGLAGAQAAVERMALMAKKAATPLRRRFTRRDRASVALRAPSVLVAAVQQVDGVGPRLWAAASHCG